ncbi:hypothetical protein SEA_KARATE_38 [Microbacterium phage Karate]|nr:hypothetical protein SEA_KARATE_38 [Microbacterium phage Karate]
MASIKCGNCGQTHTSVEQVKGCYSGAQVKSAAERLYGDNPLAMSVIQKAGERRGGRRPRFEETPQKPLPMFEEEPDEQGTPTVVYVPTTEPGASTRNKNDQTIPGFYKVDNNVYKVTPARTSDRTFAHRLITADGAAPEWEYLGLGKKYVPTYANKLTLVEAKEYGHTHGYCLICGRLLTAEQSVADGIGPICAGKL